MMIEAPGFASRVFTFSYSVDGKLEPWEGIGIGPSGIVPEPLIMGPGVEVRGRVLHKGKPVAGVLMTLEYCETDPFRNDVKPFNAKTDDHGIFRFPHVLPNSTFSAYAEIGALKDHSTITPCRIQSGDDGSTTDLGDLASRPGLTLAGKAVFPDGSAPSHDSVILLASVEHAGVGKAKLDGQGRFEVTGLPEGAVNVSLVLEGDKSTGRRMHFYHFSPKNKCIDPHSPRRLTGRLDRDVSDLTILVAPGLQSGSDYSAFPDPAVLADFNDAKSGPITGVPPKDFAKVR
jgi:hypothetical protein